MILKTSGYRKHQRYRLDDVDSDEYIKACRVRFESTLKKLPILKSPILDIGEPNALGKMLGIRDFTDWDLEYTWPFGVRKYKIITCFEVLEHIENVLIFLLEIWNHLDRDGGVLYLTTPARWKYFPGLFGKGDLHCYEYSKGDLLMLFEMTGFEIIEIDRIRGYTWQWRFFGIRPIIRWFRDVIFGQCLFIVARAL